ncbi:hypothetical protein [Pseudomonas sp. B21-048]|uniref:hypothetical protein n=1 Tax=Pseudomonas sp. B21-048 TaxID=2895490 RepID=UPI00215E341A|nr:hypothetical protein [Pseudomonas sp. B21-048]UVK96465.1 hypothetical protein LOY56_13630 [Pseudomonas sp. B21-048]
MSATIHAAMNNSANPGFGANDKRAFAVAAALETINAYVASNSGVNLESEMRSLSIYADKIQEALKV